MGVDGFGEYLEAEIEAIGEFRRSESKRIGRKLSLDEAGMQWVAQGRARQFREDYERREREH